MKIQQSVNGENEASLHATFARSTFFRLIEFTLVAMILIVSFLLCTYVPVVPTTQMTTILREAISPITQASELCDSSFNASITPFPNCQKLQKHCQCHTTVTLVAKNQSSGRN